MTLTAAVGRACFVVPCFPEHRFRAHGFFRAPVHGSLHGLGGFLVVAHGPALVGQFALWLLCSGSLVVVVALWFSLIHRLSYGGFSGSGPAVSQFRISDRLPCSSVR